MDKHQIENFVVKNANKLTPYRLQEIIERLKTLPDDDDIFQNISLKDPQLILIMSIFFGYMGVDRLMLNDTLLGVLKLITFGGCGIWAIVDWFLISDKTKEYNYQTFMETWRLLGKD